MFLLARPSIGEDPPQRGLGDDVLDPVRAKELPQWSQPRPVDKQHRLAQIAHSIEFHESCVMVGFPVRRDRVPVDEPTDAGALQQVARIHIPRDDVSLASPARFSTGPANGSARGHFTQLSKTAAESQLHGGRTAKVKIRSSTLADPTQRCAKYARTSTFGPTGISRTPRPGKSGWSGAFTRSIGGSPAISTTTGSGTKK